MGDAMVPATARDGGDVIERVVLHGDLERLTPQDRVAYYTRTCESLGLNPYTRPFEYIRLNGKLTLYARRDATDQLRRAHNVSVAIASRERVDDLLVVTARASTPDGRADESLGAVSIKGLTGEALANAMMKAETKAKRRVTLSIVGLGWTDESEVESIAGVQRVSVDPATGEISAGSRTRGSNGRPQTLDDVAGPAANDDRLVDQLLASIASVADADGLEAARAAANEARTHLSAPERKGVKSALDAAAERVKTREPGANEEG